MAKVAVIGVGYWGHNLVRNFNNYSTCEVLCVCDCDTTRLNLLRRRFPNLIYLDCFEDVLTSDIDGIVLATPVATHYKLAIEALSAGKHVFVEKPLAASVAEACELVEYAAKLDLTLMVGHTFEYSPAVIKIEEIIKSGELGDLCFISSMRVNLGLHNKDISVIWDLAPHDFSILFSWLDELPVTIAAIGNSFVQKGIADVAFISVTFPSGIIAHLEVSWLSPSKLRRTTIVGSKKMLVYDDTVSDEKVKIFDRGVDFRNPETFGEYQLSYRMGDIFSPRLDTFEPLALETAEFIDAIDNSTDPRTNGASGLRVVKALEAAHLSMEQGGVPIRFK